MSRWRRISFGVWVVEKNGKAPLVRYRLKRSSPTRPKAAAVGPSRPSAVVSRISEVEPSGEILAQTEQSCHEGQ